MNRSEHLPQIDALRGLAALVVALVFHQYYLSGDYHWGPLRGLWGFTWLYKRGWTMVDLFFVISGFIMSHVYLGHPANPRAPPSAARFAMARFARLYPLHLVTLLATAAVLAIQVPAAYHSEGHAYAGPDAWHFGLNLLMLQRTPLADGMSFNAPSWSIAVEMYCYVVFYLLIRFALRWLPWIGLAIVAGAVWAAIPEGELARQVARGFCGFFAGVALWKWGRFVPTWAALLVPVPALWLVETLEIFETINRGTFLALTLYPALVLFALRTRLLVGPVFAWLGSRSYAIYLVNAPIYWAMSLLMFGGRQATTNVSGATLLPCFALILIAAHFSYKYLEVPARRWLRGLTDKPSAAKLAAA